MSKSSKHMLKRLAIITLVISIAVIPYFSSRNFVQAAALTSMSDTLTRLAVSTASSHTIAFDMPAGDEFAAGETIDYDFDEDGSKWTVAGGSSATGDFDFHDGTGDQTIVGVDGDCTGHTGTDEVVIGINDTTGVVTVTACANYDGSGNGATITLEYGTAAGGTNRVTNPSSDGSTTLTIDHDSGTNTGTLAVPIMTSDQVTVSATVDPTITSTLSSATCSLGTLSNSQIDTCTYDNDVVTNAQGGYASTILDDGNLRTSGGDDIDDADGDVDEGTEEYGVGTSQAGQTITQNATCPDPETDPAPASAITTSAQQYGSNSGPTNGDTISLCHAASIAGTTPAGSYQHVVTHITTGTF